MLDEIELLETVCSAQQGDRNAFGTLVQEYETVVYSIVARRLRHHAEAVEVTQEVFLRALRKLPQLREPERFAGWLKRIAVRMSINRALRRPRESYLAPESFPAVSDYPSPVDGMLRMERAHQVQIGLGQLRRLDRDTLMAFYFEGQSLKEMSDRFDSPVGTIKRRLHTARHRLREALGEPQTV